MLAILTVLKELILRGKETQKLSAKKRFLTEGILCVSAALSPAASNFKVYYLHPSSSQHIHPCNLLTEKSLMHGNITSFQ